MKSPTPRMLEAERPQRHLFTLRLWQEEGEAGRPEWRGTVQHVLTRETYHFHDLPLLLPLLQRMLEEAGKRGAE